LFRSGAPQQASRQLQPKSELAEALRACRFAMVGLALFSGVINILMLTGSFFMLQVYDRVLPSRSVPTLIGLGILAGALFAFQGLLEVIRSRILMRVAEYLDVRLSPRVYQAAISCLCAPRSLVTVCSFSAISIRSALSFRAPGRGRFSTCPGCRSISLSAFCSISGSA
jgi:ABC-type protease/lipase transport system fused ATPase/permease subunit